MLVLFNFLESKPVPNVVPLAGLILLELGFQSVSVIIHLGTAAIAGFVNLAQRNSRSGLHSKSGAKNFLRGK